MNIINITGRYALIWVTSPIYILLKASDQNYVYIFCKISIQIQIQFRMLIPSFVLYCAV